MKNIFDRRDLFRYGAAGTGMVLFGGNRLGAQTAGDDAHFFINLVFPGGLDPMYFFDSRPQAMTTSKLVVNHWKEEAQLLKGANGGETLRSSLTDPLMPYQKDFTVLNGVHMIASFDGHPQNMNYLFTGSAFGGESFIPHLNKANPRAIDLIETGAGFTGAETTNSDASIPLTAKSAADFATRLASAPGFGAESALGRHIESRFNQLSQGSGGFNHAAKKFLGAHQQVPTLVEKIKGLNISEIDPTQQDEPLTTTLALIREIFRAGVSTSATWVFGGTQNPPNLDTHDGQSAAQMPDIAKNIVADLAIVFKFLKETSFDDSRSLFDVTTLMVSTEFARTMRQTYTDFERSGNDHNPLNNSIIVAGKGIVGGQVIGQSDFRSVEEVKEGAQGAHKKLDSQNLKAMGRPFDYETGTYGSTHADEYKVDNYLSVNSVINSIYKIFGVSETMYRVNERNGPVAKTVPGLIS